MFTMWLTVNDWRLTGAGNGARDAWAEKDQREGGEGGLEGFGGRAHLEGEQDRGGERPVAAGAEAQEEGVMGVGSVRRAEAPR